MTIFDLHTPYKRQTFVPDLLPIVFKTSIQGLIGQLLVKYVKHDTRMAMVTTALIAKNALYFSGTLYSSLSIARDVAIRVTV
jgi:hypothetical protein